MSTMGERSADAAERPSRRPSVATHRPRPTRRVVLLVGLLTAAGGGLWAPLASVSRDGIAGVTVPWWLLALMFAAAELWVFHIQVGREAEAISISEIPLVLGLFYATPTNLLVGRVVGPALVMVLHRRQTVLKSSVNISLILADTALAVWVFRLVGGGSVGDGPREWAGAVLAAAVAMALDLVVLNTIIRWYDGASPLPGLASSLTGVGIAAASAMLGMVPVMTLRLGALAAVPLVLAGVVLLIGYRAYASLAEQHSSLERLFRFNREISVAPDADDLLPSILRQAADLLRAECAEALRFGETGEATLRRLDGDKATAAGSHEADAAAELARRILGQGDAMLLRPTEPDHAEYLRVRSATEAVLAPLRYDGRTVGALAVHDRLGEVRGFASGDVQLLQTVASHASVALHNEMLIDRLRHDAMHDALTGLPNRAQLVARAGQALSEVRAGNGGLAVMIIDLDGFKIVNDTLGHHVGDDLIREVAERFGAVAPAGVMVARLGGDEFAVLVPRHCAEPAERVAAMLLGALMEPFDTGEERLHLAGSAGIALAPEHGTRVSDLLKRADIAMYAAKNGAGEAVVYRSEIDVNDPSVLSLMGELRQAIIDGDVGIEVEPVVELTTGRVTSVEALARWHHPVRGTLSPGLFLPLAERNGLIVPLTELVLDRAVAACADWCRQGLDIAISVNLSARSLLDTTLPQSVADTLDRHGLPSRLLTLEITESIVLSDAGRALGLLGDLRDLGVQLSLDDFGTGYSSLTHLSELPIQQLKIDRSFVSQIQDSTRDLAIVGAIAALARDLDIDVVAEGVESYETAQLLRDLGCGYAQGHYYAMSMPPPVLPVWLATKTPSASLPAFVSRIAALPL